MMGQITLISSFLNKSLRFEYKWLKNDTCNNNIYIDSIEHEYLVFLIFNKIGHTLK
jgi:hypothetical protein